MLVLLLHEHHCFTRGRFAVVFVATLYDFLVLSFSMRVFFVFLAIYAWPTALDSVAMLISAVAVLLHDLLLLLLLLLLLPFYQLMCLVICIVAIICFWARAQFFSINFHVYHIGVVVVDFVLRHLWHACCSYCCALSM